MTIIGMIRRSQRQQLWFCDNTCLVPIAVLIENSKKDFSEVGVIVVDHI